MIPFRDVNSLQSKGEKKNDLLLSSPLSLQFNIFISWFALKPHSKWKLPSWIIGTFGFKILTNHLGVSFTVDVHELPITQNHTGQNQTVKESSPSTVHASVLNYVMTLLLHLLLYHQQMPGCPSNLVYG